MKKSKLLLAVSAVLLLVAAIAGAGCVTSTNDDPIIGYFAQECSDGFIVYNMDPAVYSTHTTDFDGNVVTKADGAHLLKKTGNNRYQTDNGKMVFSLSDDANTLKIYVNGYLDGTAERMINMELPARKNVAPTATPTVAKTASPTPVKTAAPTKVPTVTPTQKAAEHDPVYGMWYIIEKDGSELDIYMDDSDMTGTIYGGTGNSMFWDKKYDFYWQFDKAVDKIRYYSLEIEGQASATVKYNGNTDTIEFYLKSKPNEALTLRRTT